MPSWCSGVFWDEQARLRDSEMLNIKLVLVIHQVCSMLLCDGSGPVFWFFIDVIPHGLSFSVSLTWHAHVLQESHHSESHSLSHPSLVPFVPIHIYLLTLECLLSACVFVCLVKGPQCECDSVYFFLDEEGGTRSLEGLLRKQQKLGCEQMPGTQGQVWGEVQRQLLPGRAEGTKDCVSTFYSSLGGYWGVGRVGRTLLLLRGCLGVRVSLAEPQEGSIMVLFLSFWSLNWSPTGWKVESWEASVKAAVTWAPHAWKQEQVWG